MSSKSLLLVGSGPGIGLSVAKLFASKGFTRIALLSRDLARLEQEAQAVASSSATKVEVKVWSVDVTAKEPYIKTLKEVGAWINEKLDLVVFNSARVHGANFFQVDEDEFVKDFETTTLALHNTFQYTLPYLQNHAVAHPSFFVTSSRIAETPMPEVFTLSVVKAAQRSLVLSMQQVFGKDVHIALVYVNARVGREDGKGLIAPEKIAGEFWNLYEDGKGEWRGDVDVQ
ncbi:hypothetical protein BJ875DRAFT_387167 [Amylocarpus encephaloides]|uniref:NAD(P)-binding protein n=1 Tax=Amylocarpus encephaloides TaxID=45428 RepID=A0A9P8C156_9HELO|nr:hypothetical protein BJ875DRAFT_387167 [Amylocarpus encephaloides]